MYHLEHCMLQTKSIKSTTPGTHLITYSTTRVPYTVTWVYLQGKGLYSCTRDQFFWMAITLIQRYWHKMHDFYAKAHFKLGKSGQIVPNYSVLLLTNIIRGAKTNCINKLKLGRWNKPINNSVLLQCILLKFNVQKRHIYSTVYVITVPTLCSTCMHRHFCVQQTFKTGCHTV